MAPRLLLGKPASDHILDSLKKAIAGLVKKTKKRPGLAVILVGNDPASQAYVGRKKKACEEIGIFSFDFHLEGTEGENRLIELIDDLNKDERVDGILLQLPLPKGYDEYRILELISPQKDVDGFHPANVGKLLLGLPTFKSCTPAGICELLRFYNIPVEGRHVVIVGRSHIVGKPLGAMLIQKDPEANATVTLCHSRTENLAKITKQADILVAAMGSPGFITADMVKKGSVVIDVGINRVISQEGISKLVGDVDFASVSKKAAAITPVPGGIGPMTIAMLMKNTVASFKTRVHIK